MKYKYSIIIPHYNIPHLLRRFLSTVPKRADVQVIVVDDASTKNLEDLQKLKQEYEWVEWHSTGTNGGGGKARNIGLEYAKGKYIIFADADDEFNNQAIEIWDKYTNLYSSYDILFFLEECISRTVVPYYENKIKNIKRLIKNENQLNKYLCYTFYQPWSKIFSRKFIIDNHISFQESLVANDMYFSVVTGVKANKVKYIEDSFYKYYIREGSTSNDEFSDIEKIKSRLKVYLDVENYFIQNKILLRPFTLYLNLLIRNLDKKIVPHIKEYLKSKLHAEINSRKYFSAIITQIPRKICEFLNLNYSGMK